MVAKNSIDYVLLSFAASKAGVVPVSLTTRLAPGELSRLQSVDDGIAKSAHVVAVQVRTRAEYHASLPWQDGAVVDVTTLAAAARGFTQSFALRSARTDRLVACIEHDWVWLDTTTGRAVPLPDEAQAALLKPADPPAGSPPT